jgi:hypothetical protein
VEDDVPVLAAYIDVKEDVFGDIPKKFASQVTWF